MVICGSGSFRSVTFLNTKCAFSETTLVCFTFFFRTENQRLLFERNVLLDFTRGLVSRIMLKLIKLPRIWENSFGIAVSSGLACVSGSVGTEQLLCGEATVQELLVSSWVGLLHNWVCFVKLWKRISPYLGFTTFETLTSKYGPSNFQALVLHHQVAKTFQIFGSGEVWVSYLTL